MNSSESIVSDADALRRRYAANKQESLSLLAAGIAHDVNNVLGVILSTAESIGLIVTDKLSDEESEHMDTAIATIRDSVRRGTSMMRELMTFAGENRGKLQRIEDPTSIVRECANLLRGVVGPSIVVSFNLPKGLPAIDADPNQCWKVIFNLVKNAAEAMKDHPGEIQIAVEEFEMTPSEADTFNTAYTPRSGKGVLFSVSDNGPGIPKSFQRRIFDPYTSSKSINRGLGLAIVSSIIEAHGGGIRVSSEEGLGSIFEFFMPVSRHVAPSLPTADDAPQTQKSPTDTNLPRPASHRSILIVEDDPSIVRTTSILLQAMKFTVLSAANRHDAMLQFRLHSRSLGCVLMDAHIGDTDTPRLLRTFRLTDSSVPIVVISGSSQDKIKEMFSSQPYNDFLAKPFTFAELKSCVTGLNL